MIMSEEQENVQNLEEQNYVEIFGEDGQIIKCEIVDVIDFENKTYALLLPLEEQEDEDEAEVIVMEYVELGDDDGYFQNIDNEDEFNKVCQYIQSLDDENDEE